MRSAIANKAVKMYRANLSRLRFKISLHDTAPTICYGLTFQPELPERCETVRSNSSIRRVRCKKIGTKKKKRLIHARGVQDAGKHNLFRLIREFSNSVR